MLCHRERRASFDGDVPSPIGRVRLLGVQGERPGGYYLGMYFGCSAQLQCVHPDADTPQVVAVVGGADEPPVRRSGAVEPQSADGCAFVYELSG